MASNQNLARVVSELVARGELRYGRPYPKAELVLLLAKVAGDEAAHKIFAELRRVVREGRAGAHLFVHTSGARRGLKYIFTENRADRGVAPVGEERSGSPKSTPAPCRVRLEPAAAGPGRVEILEGDNLPHLRAMETGRFRLIYVDPPFNTGKRQARTRITTVRDEQNGDRTGFKGQRYRTVVQGTKAFGDAFDDYLGFLAPRLEEAHRLLAPDGSLFVHLDYREVHYAKILLDEIFGRDCFMNEIVWAYDYGARSKRKWSTKHDNILWYARSPERYVFNFEEMDRIPYMAPGLVGPQKAARGKTPTDVWWHTIVSPNGREKTGYPTQKPLGVLRRIVKVHSEPGDTLLDFFAGSGTLGEAGAELGRSVVLVDSNDEALKVMHTRLSRFLPRDDASLLPDGAHPSSADGLDEQLAAGAGRCRSAPATPRSARGAQTDLFGEARPAGPKA